MNGVLLLARVQARIFPGSWLYAMGRFSARQIVRFSSGVRESVMANGRRLLGANATEERLQSFAVDVVTNFTRFFIGMLRAPRDYPSREVLLETMQGREHGEHVLGLGRGAICVTLHLGNYELGALLAERFQPAAIVYRPDPFHLVERLRSKTRDFADVGEITTDRMMFGVEVLDLLRRGGAAFVAGDIGFAGEAVGDEQPFFGGRARFHSWPARLSVSSGAPILLCFAPYDEEMGMHRIVLEPPILPEEFGNDADAITHAMVQVFERHLQRHPEQWLILHRYWVE